jgi:hypothetical protein
MLMPVSEIVNSKPARRALRRARQSTARTILWLTITILWLLTMSPLGR